MSKSKKNQENTNTLCEYIINDYVNNIEEDGLGELMRNLPLLIANNMACEIVGRDDISFPTDCTYKIASMFIQKYNKGLKSHRRKLKDYEIGGSENTFADTDDRLIKLSRYSLDSGRYVAQLSKTVYCLFIVTVDEKDDYIYDYKLYFIGKKWTKWKNKFYELVDEYTDIQNKKRTERILYVNGQSPITTIFKPFDHLIFTNKEYILKYIDNWINNIPRYYEEYKMISKLSIILYGEPGTGKSTFCRALAKHLGITDVVSLGPDYFNNNNNNNEGK